MRHLEQIKTLDELEAVARDKKCVVVPSMRPWEKPRPARFIFMLQGESILRMMRAGMYVYVPKEKPKHKPMKWQEYDYHERP